VDETAVAGGDAVVASLCVSALRLVLNLASMAAGSGAEERRKGLVKQGR
jgi:hypothetical protein